VRRPLPSPEEIAALPPDGGPEFNRLIHEKSPYLLQHARNPVDWYPWGAEAFERAAADDKPIFLSIGYSTCHWCHVMEHESFEDEEVASLMNASFVCIKVDREERPDLDQVYMTVTQQLTGSGGWPMTVVLAPDKRPFFAGTYFPKSGRSGRPGMMELVPALADAWKNRREDVMKSAEQITSELARATGGAPGTKPTAATLDLCYEQLAARYDPQLGGFGRAPKFPTPHNLRFLLRYHARSGEEQALDMVESTLSQMRKGGIWDHVGFGFHRYSTDREWLLPHFEKMLYDQALIAMACIEAAQATGKREYERTAREIFTYVLRDMTSPEGAFYSAEDADSEGEEGLFYLWTPEELVQALGPEDGELAIRVYGVEKGGNFTDQASGQKTGESILHLSEDLAEIAAREKLEPAILEARLESIRSRLFAVREEREHPLKDDKVLTEWNALMISALARAASAFGDEGYARAASRAADFMLAKLRDEKGRLYKRYRAGEASLAGVLDDYAYTVAALIDLYEAAFDERYLAAAVELDEAMRSHFWDERRGGLFLAPDDGEALIVRSKECYDGALPSGNSVAAMNFLRLARLTGAEELSERADAIFGAFGGDVTRAPSSTTELMLALDFATGPSHEIVLVGERGAADTRALEAKLREVFLPNKVVLFRPASEKEPAIARLAPFVSEQEALEGRATAYVCRDFACEAPTNDPERLLASLREAAKARH
jgi:uncharacterized protein YyaL (SSP411 family)